MSKLLRSRIPALLIFAVLLVSTTSGGQLPSSLSGPVLGYVFDSTGGTLRPVRGVLGSATVGDPVDTGFGIAKVLTLDERRAIAATDSNAALVVVTVDGGQVSTKGIPGLLANPILSVASIRQTAAAFYYAEPLQVRIVAGLPQEPRHVATFQLDRPLTQMAVNDDGTLLVYAGSAPDGEAIYTWMDSSSGPRFITSTLSVSGIALTQSGDAVVADRAANEVFAIWDAAGGALRKILAGVESGLSAPAGVTVAGNKIYVANGRSVAVLDPSGRVLRNLPCSCSVSAVHPLRESVFRLTEGIKQTIFLLDASSAEERILFVPPPLN